MSFSLINFGSRLFVFKDLILLVGLTDINSLLIRNLKNDFKVAIFLLNYVYKFELLLD